MMMEKEDLKSIKQSSLPSTFGTPNDVRLFPGTTARSAGVGMSSTRSIPIANSERSLTEIQQDEEEELAEYRDHAMYLRIVHGMKEKQLACTATATSASSSRAATPTSQISLHGCVSDCVAKIARTRNSKLVRDDNSGHYWFKEAHAVNDVRLGYQNVLQMAESVCWNDADEEGIFEMDL